MLKNKWFWIVLALVVLLGGGGYYYYTAQSASASTASATEAAMQTSVARTGDLVITASGTGQVVPGSELALGFDENGTLIELRVGVGEEVKKGDVLAQLQTTSSPAEIAASVSDAELAVISAGQALEALYANADISRTEALNDIAAYAQEVRDAQWTLENYSMPTFLQGMDAITALDLMKERLDAALAAFEPYKYYPATDDTRYNLLVALNAAQSNYDAAVKRLNYEYTLEVAEANLAKARQEYDQYKDGPAKDDLTLAQAELDNAKAKLALAQEAKAVLELVAPIDGTIMSIDADVGEAVGSTAFITLADLDHLELEVYLDETDLDKVAAGYEAEVSFDAFPDQVFKGAVVTVSPGLESVSDVQAVKIVVSLDASSLDVNLPVGLNATVDVIAGRATGAVLVPVEALRELDPGEYAVFVVENGAPVLREVEVGLQDVTSAQIISGVQAGETVSTGIIQTGQ